MKFNLIERISIIVYIKNIKQIKKLKKYGKIEYFSSKMKYVIIYINESELENTITLLKMLSFVKAVDVSHLKEIDTTIGSINDEYEFDNLEDISIEIDEL